MSPAGPETCCLLRVPQTSRVQPVEQSQRARRVRFTHPVRVATIDGEPRAWRTLAANLSRDGLFVRMPQPLDPGTRVAISLEASGQTLPFAQGEVRWCRYNPSELDGRFQGCGVRFTGFLHPRAPELVHYLVVTLDTGKLLTAAPMRRRRWPWTLAAGLVLGAMVAALALSFAEPEQPPLPSPTGDPGPLAVLAIAPRVNDELAALVSPAEDGADSPGADETDEVADVPGVAPRAGVAVVPADARGAGTTTDVAVAPDEARGAETTANVAVVPGGSRAGTTAVVQADARGAETTAHVAVVPGGSRAGTTAVVQADARGAETTAHVAGVPGGRRAGTTAVVQADARGAGTTGHVAVVTGGGRAGATEVVQADARGAETTAEVVVVPGEAIGAGPSPGVALAPAAARSAESTVDVSLRERRERRSGRRAMATAGGELSLPTGAATAVTWTSSPDGLDVRPSLRGDAKIARVFSLADPPRLVFDIDGAAPQKSLSLPTPSPLISRVRLGKQGARTRVVLDLASTPQHIRAASDHAVVHF
ncbi:MAG: AMIN domain-containing protein [Myxococcaceae bacterium]|nr:AMIN domain-containing protein [Myxococcaceae bacterium]